MNDFQLRDANVAISTILMLIVCVDQAGGSVSTNGRLQGRLEVSRAFGDRHFKKVLKHLACC